MRELVVVLLLAVPLAVLANHTPTHGTDSPANPSSINPSDTSPGDTSPNGESPSGETPSVVSDSSGETPNEEELCRHEDRFNLLFDNFTNSKSAELVVEDAYDLDFAACKARCCDRAESDGCNAANLVVDKDTSKLKCRLFKCDPDFYDCEWVERATFYASHIILKSSEESSDEYMEDPDALIPELGEGDLAAGIADESSGEELGDELGEGLGEGLSEGPEGEIYSEDAYEQEEEADEALEKIFDELLEKDYNDAMGYGSTPAPIDAGDVAEANANADGTGFGSAYLGSFQDSPIDKPALIIGCTATVLFVVIVLVCVGLKISNNHRSKYKPLRESTFNSNSVNQPLTGGYETYE